jgi:Family of unknown function (DUF6460)
MIQRKRMSEENRTAPHPPPPWPQGPGADQNRWGAETPREDTALVRFLGGPPGSVFLRLLFVSLIVGAFLMWLDIRPWDVFLGLKQLADRIWNLGFDAIREVADYILAGAVLVVPVWLVLRLMNMRNGR